MIQDGPNTIRLENSEEQRPLPLVSVIIPTYNRAKYVTLAVDSVLEQTYRNFEIIVVDDGSTDNTRAVLQSYRSRIQCISKTNAGASAARNTGIKAATGKWIAFLDSDDVWYPEKLQVQMDFAAAHPEIVAHAVNLDLSQYGPPYADSFSHCGFPLDAVDGIITNPLQFHLKYRVIMTSSAVICRKDSAQNAGLWDEELPFANDYDFMCRMALQGPWGYCRSVLAALHRRIEPSTALSVRRSEPVGRWRARVHIYKKVLSCELSPKDKKVVQGLLAGALRQLGYSYLKDDKALDAGDAFEQSFLYESRFNIKNIKAVFGRWLTRCPQGNEG